MKRIEKIIFALAACLVSTAAAISLLPKEKSSAVSAETYFAGDNSPFITAGDNLLSNAGFEKTIITPMGDATELRTSNWTNVGWCDQFSSYHSEGAKSLKVCFSYNNLQTSSTFPGVYQDVEVERNTTYAVTFDARIDNNDYKTFLKVGYRDPLAESVWVPVTEYTIAKEDFTTSFARYQYTIDVGDRDCIRLFFYTQGMNESNYRAFYIDDVIMKKLEGVDDSAAFSVGAELTSSVGEEGGAVAKVRLFADYGWHYKKELTYESAKATFSSSDPKVASVSSDGVVTPLSQGNTEITVELESAEGSGKQIFLPYIVYEKKPDDLVIGETLPLLTDGKNLLKNASFKESISVGNAAELQTENWNCVMGGFDSVIEAGRNGTNCAKITYQWQDMMNNTNFPGQYQDVAVEKNTTYEYSVWLQKWSASSPDNTVRLGFRNPLAGDVWSPVYELDVPARFLTAAWTKYTIYFNTGDLDMIRVFVYSNAQSGSIAGGYNVDDASLCKAVGIDENVAAKAFVLEAEKTDLEIGNDSILLKAKIAYPYNYYENVSDISLVTFKVDDEEILEVSADGLATGKRDGVTTVTATMEIGGTMMESSSVEITVKTAFELKQLDLGLTGTTVSTGERLPMQIVVKTDKGEIIDDGFVLNFTSSDLSKAIAYSFGDRYYIYGLSAGKTTVGVTAEYFGKEISASVEITVTGSIVVDGGFEFYEELSAKNIGWKIAATCGAGTDNSADNIFSRTGNGNLWCMSPVYWDASIPANGYVKIYQDVELEAGEYTFSAYIKRFYATGPNGMLDGFGGTVSIGFSYLEDGFETGENETSSYGTDVGANDAYEKISHTALLRESGRYRLVIMVMGDRQFGLGMQIDDAELTPSVNPKELNVTIENGDKLSVGDLAAITVTVTMGDGSILTDVGSITFLSSNRQVATISSGYIVVGSEGSTDITVRCTVNGRQLEKIVKLTIGGGSKSSGCGSFMSEIPLMMPFICTIFLFIRKHKENIR